MWESRLYSIAVAAVVVVAFGMVLAQDDLAAPKLWVSDVTDTRITLSWSLRSNPAVGDSPRGTFLSLVSHVILFWKEHSQRAWSELKVPLTGQLSSYTLTELKADSIYELYIESWSGQLNLKSRPSESILVRTAPPGQSGGRRFFSSFTVMAICVTLVIITVAAAIAYYYIKMDELKVDAMRREAFLAQQAAIARHLSAASVPPSPGPSGMNKKHSTPQSGNISASSMSTSLVSEESSLFIQFSDSGSEKSRSLQGCPMMNTLQGPTLRPQPIWKAEAIVEESETGSSLYATLPCEKIAHLTGLDRPTPPPPTLPPPLPPMNAACPSTVGLLQPPSNFRNDQPQQQDTAGNMQVFQAEVHHLNIPTSSATSTNSSCLSNKPSFV